MHSLYKTTVSLSHFPQLPLLIGTTVPGPLQHFGTIIGASTLNIQIMSGFLTLDAILIITQRLECKLLICTAVMRILLNSACDDSIHCGCRTAFVREKKGRLLNDQLGSLVGTSTLNVPVLSTVLCLYLKVPVSDSNQFVSLIVTSMLRPLQNFSAVLVRSTFNIQGLLRFHRFDDIISLR